MAYLKPSAPLNVVNALVNRLIRYVSPWDVHTLEVPRRSTGQIQHVPVIPVRVDGTLYVVSTRGEADWVRNVRHAGRVRLAQKGTTTTYSTREVATSDRAPVITAYRRKAGREVEGYWRKLPDDADHPTFALTPA